MKSPSLAIFALTISALSVAPCAHAQADQKPATTAPVVSPDDNVKPAVPGVKDITANELEALLKEKKVTVLDVRTSTEFNDGHIAGAVLVNLRDPDFQANIAKLDKNQPYAVHCQAGGRSSQAVVLLHKAGFKNILHLKEGFGSWKDGGKPVDKTPAK